MLIIQDVTYIHPNKELLFSDLHLVINRQDKVALIGNNGTGKSTLLQIMAGQLLPSAGTIKAGARPYYVPQLFGQFSRLSIAQALGIDGKLQALKAILEGEVTEEHLAILDDDWTIEERCREAFAYWQIGDTCLHQQMGTLSGGQKARVLLAGIQIHHPGIVLLDEPSNHLDVQSRRMLYEYIQSTNHTLVVVSHDRTLLNLLPVVYELGKRGITVYGGNYDFYRTQKQIEANALNQELKNTEKALRKARETARETLERQQKLDARGKKKQEKAGLPTISMNTFRNNAEKSTARIKGVHAEKSAQLSQELDELRSALPGTDSMKLNVDNSALHKGKILVTAKAVNVAYSGRMLWENEQDIIIASGERIAIKGPNGSGKTTLLKMILGELQPSSGTIERTPVQSIYIDQDYSLVNDAFTVYEQAQQFNNSGLQEHEIKIRLHRFLFTSDDWDKPCKALSGGEKMRLMLCCLTIRQQAPDMIVLDEPTNNLDIQNLEILTRAINEYKGSLLVVSHDACFLEEIGVERELCMPGRGGSAT